MKPYDFDEIIDRRGTNAMNTDGFRSYLFQDEDITFPFSDEDFIRLWVADMEFAVPDVILEAVRRRLDRRIFGYTGVFDPAYVEAFRSWNKRRYGWDFPDEHVVTSPGIVPALYHLVRLLTKPDEKVLILTPSYAFFKHAPDFYGREAVCSDLINDGNYYRMDLEDIKRKAADEKTTLCIFCNPHNPTGRVWTKAELTSFARIMEEEDVWVISDEIHCDLLRRGQQHLPLGKVMEGYQKLVTCMAPTKTFNLAGFMISNLIIPDPALRDEWEKNQFQGENPLSIAAAQAAYQSGEDWLEELKNYLDGNFALTRDFLNVHLPLAHFRIPEATYLAWIDISAYLPDSMASVPLYFAREARVLLEDGRMFVANGEGFIRLNIACPRLVLQEGLERIARALTK